MNEAPPPSAFATRPPGRILFLCVHNSSRSQIAEGFARGMAPPNVEVMSAGSEPRGVNPHAVAVMNEVGVDITNQRSKHLDDVEWRNADTIVTLCGEGADVCPAVTGDVRRVHWPLPDPTLAPADRQMEVFREVRDEIRWRVSALWPHGD